jgi:tetratricopeptide (TPR) repeat protein
MTVNFPDLFEQANRFVIRGQVTEAIAAYRDIAALATEQHEATHYARAILGAGAAATLGISERGSSYYRDALTLLAEALERANVLDDRQLQGTIYRQMGVAAHAAHDFGNTAVFFQKSLEVLERLDGAEAETAATYACLGAHLGRLGQLDGAEQMLDKALTLFTKAPLNGRQQAEARAEMAVVKMRRGEWEEAAKYAEEAAGWFEADHDKDKFTFALCRLYGLLRIIKSRQLDSKGSKQYQDRYGRLLKTLEVVTADAVQSELNLLAR